MVLEENTETCSFKLIKATQQSAPCHRNASNLQFQKANLNPSGCRGSSVDDERISMPIKLFHSLLETVMCRTVRCQLSIGSTVRPRQYFDRTKRFLLWNTVSTNFILYEPNGINPRDIKNTIASAKRIVYTNKKDRKILGHIKQSIKSTGRGK